MADLLGRALREVDRRDQFGEVLGADDKYVNGVKVSGTLADKGAQRWSPDASRCS